MSSAPVPGSPEPFPPPGAHAEFTSVPTSPALALDDIYFVLFKHKWLIACFAIAGIFAAWAALKIAPPPYASQAKLLIRYVQDKQTTLAPGDESRIRVTTQGPEAIMNTEVEILKSFDLALEVARTLGPSNILGQAPASPEDAERAAAGVVQAGLGVETSSSVVTVKWEGQARDAVQPILNQVITTYLKRHLEVHSASGLADETLTRQTDQLRARLNQTEEDLRKLKERSGVTTLDESKRELTGQINALEKEIYATQVEIAERRTTLSAMSGGSIEEGVEVVAAPDDKRASYRQVNSQLTTLYQREQQLLAQFTAQSPMVKAVRAEIQENEYLKQRLEREFPVLLQLKSSGPASSGGDRNASFDTQLQSAQLKAKETRVKVLNEQLGEVRARLASVSAAESAIAELQRKKDLEEQQYRYFSTNLEQSKIDEQIGAGKISNISVLQAPSPPVRSMKKVSKVLAMLGLGGIALGLGLAFGFELFINQAVKRPSDVESKLGLPLILTIPRSLRSLEKRDRTYLALESGKPAAGTQGDPSGSAPPSNAALVPWSTGHELKNYFDALRNRLIYNFEMRGISRKPKLVAVTSCGPNSGVSTVAAGLAASLSETGEGNVLLVDMNPDRTTPHFFHKGSISCDLTEALEHEKREDALVQNNLYVVSNSGREDRLSWIMPKRFANIVPKLKASDFDYIIFDLPPVSQISVTSQLARHMDMALLVVESEKTNREVIKRASNALAESGVALGVVLNKTHNYIPTVLQQDT